MTSNEGSSEGTQESKIFSGPRLPQLILNY